VNRTNRDFDRRTVIRRYLDNCNELTHTTVQQTHKQYNDFVKSVTEPVRYAGSLRLETPAIVHWEITHACNLHCEYCYFNVQAHTPSMPLDKTMTFIDQMAECKVISVVIEGGEPFLYKHLIPVVERLKQHRIAVTILTNGTLINAQDALTLRQLLDPAQDYIQVSLDAAHAIVQDAMDGDGSFEKAVRGLHALSHAGHRFGVSMVVTHNNLYEVLPTYKLISQIPGVVVFNVSRAFVSGKASQDLVSVDKYVLANEFVMLQQFARANGGPRVNARLGHAFDLPEYRRHMLATAARMPGVQEVYCTASRSQVCVDYDGSVYGCHFLIYPELQFGNVTHQHLRDIWNSERAKQIAAGRDPDAECYQCRLAALCTKKCMGFAYALQRNLNHRDPNCTYLCE